MKNLLLLGLACTLLAFPMILAADDAKVMPKNVGRLFVVPTFGSAETSYDADGNADHFDPIKMFNLGFALEYGLGDWISAAAQWAPGATLSSDLNSKNPYYGLVGTEGRAHMNDLADLFLGAKIQLIGPKAPVTSSKFRVAFAPGLLVPLTQGPDFKSEVDGLMTDIMAGTTGILLNPTNVLSQEQAQAAATKEALSGRKLALNKMDNHAFATGFRAYFDWLLSDNIFINFFNESLFYLQKKDLHRAGPNYAMWQEGYKEGVIKTLVGTGMGAQDALAAANGIDFGAAEVDYKYKISFEIEPVIAAPLADNSIIFNFCLPVRYVYTPAYEYSFKNLGQGTPLDPGGAASLDYLDTNSHQTLYFTPAIQFLVLNSALPIEFKIQYGIPLALKNATAMNLLTVQMRLYFKT